jgi:hypothetical protein
MTISESCSRTGVRDCQTVLSCDGNPTSFVCKEHSYNKGVRYRIILGDMKPTQNYVKSFNFYSWRKIRDQLSVSIHNFAWHTQL